MCKIKIATGKRIKQLADAAGLSITFLACDSNLDRSYILDVLKGNRNVSIESMEKICAALHVSLYEFFNDELFEEIK